MKLLFICSRNKLRSPTAEAIFANYDNLDVMSAGLDRDAEMPLQSEDVLRADILFVMEQSHRRKLSQRFHPWLKNKRVVRDALSSASIINKC